MPFANESATVEWHNAQVMPTRVNVLLPLTVSTVPLMPTTASRLISASVVSGLVRLMLPSWMPATTDGGSASASTFSPTASAVVGSTAAAMTSFMCSVSVHVEIGRAACRARVCQYV